MKRSWSFFASPSELCPPSAAEADEKKKKNAEFNPFFLLLLSPLPSSMPFYELFCLARPGLARASRADLMSSLGKKVLEAGGIVTDVSAHGERRLAYEIRRPGVTFGEVGMSLLLFLLRSSVEKMTMRALSSRHRRKRVEIKGEREEISRAIEFDDLDGGDDGLSDKKKNTNLFPFVVSLPFSLSLNSGLHLAARVRGPGLDPLGPSEVAGPRRQGSPLGAAGEERPRAQGADDGGRRKGGAEETRERRRGKVKGA